MDRHMLHLYGLSFALMALVLCCAGDARAQAPVEAAAPLMTWHVESVPASSNDYTPMGFVMDASGQVHMTFMDSTNAPTHALVYAGRTGGAWYTETVSSGLYVGWSSDVALFPGGGIAIAYTDDRSVKYATPETADWAVDVVDVEYKHLFENVGLGFDSSGVPQIGYTDWDVGIVKYARYDKEEDEWRVETVADNRSAAFHVDGAGTPHFVYKSAGKLVHAVRASPGWASDILGSGISASVAWKGSVPCLAYTYDGGKPVGLYYRCGAGGQEILIDSAARGASLAISPSGAPHVLFRDASMGWTYAALHGGKWIRETMAQDLGKYVNDLHLIIDGSNRPRLGYKDGGHPRYAWADGSILPESEFALSPDDVTFTTHFATWKPDTVLVTRRGEPASTADTFDVALQVKGKQDVEWEVKAPAWVEVQPATGKGPATLHVGLKLKPDEVKAVGKRTGTVTVQSPDGRISAKLGVSVEVAPRRYIHPPAKELVDHLRGLLYTEALDPSKSARPVGSVLLWGDPGSTWPAHSTVVVNETTQLGMRLAVLADDRYGAPSKGVGTYVALAVWEPPAGMGSFDESRIPAAYRSTSLPREYSNPVRRWNCHGYSSVLVYFGFEPSVRAGKGASVSVKPGMIKVNQGKVWYRGAVKMMVDTPLGPFDVESECTVDVKADGQVEFHLFGGSAVFHGAAGDVSLKPNEKIVIAAAGRPGPVTAFDPSKVYRWWEWIDVEQYGLFLPAVRR